MFTELSYTRREMLAAIQQEVNKEKIHQQGVQMPSASSIYRKGHETNDCFQLKKEIERLINLGYLQDYILKKDMISASDLPPILPPRTHSVEG